MLKGRAQSRMTSQITLSQEIHTSAEPREEVNEAVGRGAERLEEGLGAHDLVPDASDVPFAGEEGDLQGVSCAWDVRARASTLLGSPGEHSPVVYGPRTLDVTAGVRLPVRRCRPLWASTRARCLASRYWRC